MQPHVTPSSPEWVAAACAAPDEILLDHAHCEKKAASTAIGFVFRHPERARLVVAMSRLAREELLHFERVLAVLRARDIPFRRFPPSPYGEELYKRVRAEQPGKLVDQLLVCALIEARSCERFSLLARAMPDRALASLYEELGPSEERHASLYVELACEEAPEAEVLARLAELATEEAKIISAPGAALRLHAGC